MNDDLIDRLDALRAAVPDAPAMANAVMRRVTARRARWPRRLTAVAAAAIVFAAGYVALSGSAPPAFAQVVARVERVNVVRFRRTQTSNAAEPATTRVERYVLASGGRSRREWGDPVGNASYRVDEHGHRTRILAPGEVVGPHVYVTIRNGVQAPGDELWIEPAARTVEISPTDAGRLALRGDDPLAQLKRIGIDGTRPAPDEVVDGRKVHVFTDAPDDPGHARRVLVDVATDLPVRIEARTGPSSTLVYDQFEWNAPIDATTFDPTPPAGFAVTFDAVRPLQHGLYAYAEQFDGNLPDRLDASALAAFDAAPPTSRPAGFTKADDRLELQWALDVPAFARRHGLDLVYAGAGKRLVLHKQPSTMLAAVETTPGSGVYDVLMSDVSHDTLRRDQLPTTQPATRP